MNKNRDEDERIFNAFGWKPDDGDYSVSNEIKNNNQKKKSNLSFCKMIKSFFKHNSKKKKDLN